MTGQVRYGSLSVQRSGAADDSWAALFRRPRYLPYFAAVVIARTASTMFNVAVVVFIAGRTGSLTMAGLVAGAASFPAAITGPLLGAWLDVAVSRRVLIVLDQLSSVAALIGILTLAGSAPDWLLVVLAGVFGVTRPLSTGAFSSVLREVVGDDLIRRADVMESLSLNVSFIVGPGLAGFVAARFGAGTAVGVEAAITILASLLIAFNDTFDIGPRSTQAPVRRALSAGLQAMWRIVPLRAAASMTMFGVLAWGTLTVSLPAYASRLGAEAGGTGYLWAAFSVGSAFSGLALTTWSARISTLRLLTGSFLGISASAMLWPLAGSLPAGMLLVGLTGAFEGPALAAMFTIRQRYTPPCVRNQLFATIASLNFAGIGAGAALAGPVEGTLGLVATLIVFSVFEALAALSIVQARAYLRGNTAHG